VHVLHSELGAGGQAALLRAVHAALLAKAKLASWAPGAAARLGPHAGVTVSFGDAACQLQEVLQLAWHARGAQHAWPPPRSLGGAAAPPPPHPLCLLEPPASMLADAAE
jgi:hypothetical protein